MNDNHIYLLVIFIIISFVAYNSCKKIEYKRKEMLNERHGDVCYICDDKNFAQCLECYDCGYYIGPNESKCVAGDPYGPYDEELKKSCQMWYHNDPFSREIWYGKRFLPKKSLGLNMSL